MIHLLSEPATTEQMQEMLNEYGDMIKIVVDIRRGMLAGGAEMHYECEEVLLEQGSEQDDLWGANWYPARRQTEFESLINIRPRLNNRSMLIQSPEIREKVESITLRLLGGILP
ncbi:MAG: hypothetical protein KJZ93_00195 [Caldilineaceae bacterium]|nr:hypothetical protein [Caldilineaceae bacterium]